MRLKIEAVKRLARTANDVEVYVYNKFGRLISSDSYGMDMLKTVFKGDAAALLKGKTVRYQKGSNVYYRCMHQVADKATQRLNVNDPGIVDSAE